MRIYGALLAVSLLCPTPRPVRAQDTVRYDISYFWDADPAKVRAQRDAIAAALGPAVDDRLKVVRSEAGWAVVYRRDGDAEGARLVAQTHTRILQTRGLGAAAPVRAREWTELRPDGTTVTPDAAAVARRAAADEDERMKLAEVLEARVKALRRQGRLAKDERTAWTVYDFTTGEQLVSINEDMKFQAASLIKPFIALAYFHEVEAKRLPYDAAARERLTRMIQRSDNNAANWALRRLGGPKAAQRLLKRDYGGMLKDLELVEYIPRGGRTYRNKASASDYSRFLLALWRDELPGSREIRRLMALPKRDRLRSDAPYVPEDTGDYSKTGSTRHLCGDMGVLLARTSDGREYPYALVGLIEKRAPARHYIRWLRSRGNVIREISGLVYRGIGELHGFAHLQLAAR